MAIRSHHAVVLTLALLALVVGAVFARTSFAANEPQQIRWLISHQPTDIFANATKVFADELSARTDGRLQLQVVVPQDAGFSSGDIPNSKVFEMLDNGDVELGTTYTVPLGEQSRAVWATGLPLLFDDYDHATVALDGPGAEQILQEVSDKTSAHALAFTMSGGFRIIVSKSSVISSVDDLKGKRIATSGGPVAEATLKSLGAVPVAMDLENGSKQDLTGIDGVETTYSRLSEVVSLNAQYTKFISETNHSLFLTVLLASDKFYNSLSPADRVALSESAMRAAQVERRDSIALGDRTRQQLVTGGSTVTTLTSAAREEFEKAVAPVVATFAKSLGSDVVAALANAGR